MYTHRTVQSRIAMSFWGSRTTAEDICHGFPWPYLHYGICCAVQVNNYHWSSKFLNTPIIATIMYFLFQARCYSSFPRLFDLSHYSFCKLFFPAVSATSYIRHKNLNLLPADQSSVFCPLLWSSVHRSRKCLNFELY